MEKRLVTTGSKSKVHFYGDVNYLRHMYFLTVLECSVDAEVVYRVCRSLEYPLEVPVLVEHHARPRVMLDALDGLLQVPERKK